MARWMSTDRTEEFFLKAPFTEIAGVLTDVLEKVRKDYADDDVPALVGAPAPDHAALVPREPWPAARPAAPAPAPPAPAAPPAPPAEETALTHLNSETTQQYKKRIGRWAREALVLLKEPSYLTVIRVSYETRRPLRHFMHFLQSKLTDEKYDGRCGSHLSALAWGKSLDFIIEWEDLLDDVFWVKHGIDLSPDTREHIVFLVSSYAGGYHRRIHTRVGSMPVQLLVFAKTPPNQACNQRRRVAIEALSSVIPLEQNLELVKSTWPEALTKASVDGTFELEPYAAISALRAVWKATTEEQESDNPVITHMGELAPNMDVETASSRLVIKKDVERFHRAVASRRPPDSDTHDQTDMHASQG